MLEFPERAARLRNTKLDQVAEMSPQRLLSGNIGCRMHLAAGLRQRKNVNSAEPMPVEHPLVLLARQLQSPEHPR